MVESWESQVEVSEGFSLLEPPKAEVSIETTSEAQFSKWTFSGSHSPWESTPSGSQLTPDQTQETDKCVRPLALKLRLAKRLAI